MASRLVNYVRHSSVGYKSMLPVEKSSISNLSSALLKTYSCTTHAFYKRGRKIWEKLRLRHRCPCLCSVTLHISPCGGILPAEKRAAEAQNPQAVSWPLAEHGVGDGRTWG